MELFMMQLRRFSEHQLDHTAEDPLESEGSPMKFDFGMTHDQISADSLKVAWP